MAIISKLFFILLVSLMFQLSTCSDNSDEDQLDYVYVIKPKGMQCETPFFDSISDAQKELEGKSIRVEESNEVLLVVCLACSVCPESEHYVMKILRSDLSIAEELGWNEYEGDDSGS